jgi:hypothetical protein
VRHVLATPAVEAPEIAHDYLAKYGYTVPSLIDATRSRAIGVW